MFSEELSKKQKRCEHIDLTFDDEARRPRDDGIAVDRLASPGADPESESTGICMREPSSTDPNDSEEEKVEPAADDTDPDLEEIKVSTPPSNEMMHFSNGT